MIAMDVAETKTERNERNERNEKKERNERKDRHEIDGTFSRHGSHNILKGPSEHWCGGYSVPGSDAFSTFSCHNNFDLPTIGPTSANEPPAKANPTAGINKVPKFPGPSPRDL